MTGLGWEENMVSGDFDVSKQIEAIENFTADQVDVLLVFPVNGPAVTDAVKKARDAGIKVIIMVDETTDEQWDAFLSSDNEATGRCNAWLCADYINKTYPDAEPGSIPVALIQIYDTPTDEQQSVGLEAVTEYTDKVNVAARYEISGQNKEDGQKAAETLHTTNPEIKFFITTSNAVALGFNEFYTGMASPISEEEYKDYGVWGTNASEEALTAVAASTENAAILRGINIQAGIQETADNIARIATGLMDGTVDHEDSPATVYLINGDTVFTYFETQKSPLQWDYATGTVVEVDLG
jgi:ABC-type sugar transport system substrate-binding protein